MASKKKSASKSSRSTKPKGPSEAEKFRNEQKEIARGQNLNADNAVPEKRPIAADQAPDSESETTKRLRESGALQEEPMPKSAYDRAESKDRLKLAKSQERVPSLETGARVVFISGDYEGNYGSVVERSFSPEQEAIRAAGNAESKFAQPDSVTVRTRGGRHALVVVPGDEIDSTLRRADETELGHRGEA